MTTYINKLSSMTRMPTIVIALLVAGGTILLIWPFIFGA